MLGILGFSCCLILKFKRIDIWKQMESEKNKSLFLDNLING